MLKDPAVFDAPFFGITAREATAMDPQQRWALEAAYHAFENGNRTFNYPSTVIGFLIDPLSRCFSGKHPGQSNGSLRGVYDGRLCEAVFQRPRYCAPADCDWKCTDLPPEPH